MLKANRILLSIETISKNLEFLEDGIILQIDLSQPSKVTIPWNCVFDLLAPTMFGLLEDLIPGTPLQEEFQAEWNTFEIILQDSKFRIPDPSYGEWVFYPKKSHLVRTAPRRWHRISQLIRNSTLIYEKGSEHDWKQARVKLDQMVLAVAGASVGSQMLHVTNMMLRPPSIKIADAKSYQLNNSNRVRLAYHEFGRNKAEVVANQLLENDPFVQVFPYSEGIHQNNISSFINGSDTEPKATVVIEETDDIDVKVLIREEARKQRIPVVMVTDIGRAAQVDVRRFDLDGNLTLVVGISDDELYSRKKVFDADPGSRNNFFDLVFAMSGKESIYSIEDFRKVVFQEVVPSFAGIPQLGSAAAMAAGLSAWIISRIVLGYSTPERILLDPNSSHFKIIGGKL